MTVQLTRRLAIGLALSMAASLGVAEAARPRRRLADLKGHIDLEHQVPQAFGGWTVDNTLIPVLPDPTVQAKLDILYSQTVARTYRDARGRRVMLSIAYGSDQTSEATSVHRPEFCYSAQGFRVRALGQPVLAMGNGQLQVQRLVASGPRFEPISYWVTLDEKATLPGLGRKLAQLNYGLHGDIPDGMLVRVSTLELREDESFQVQEQFLDALYAALDPAIRRRYFGA